MSTICAETNRRAEPVGPRGDGERQPVLPGKYARYEGSGTTFGGFPDKSVFWLQTAYKY